MRTVLVLNAGPAAIPGWLRRALPGVGLSDHPEPEPQAAIIVVNDHSAAVTGLLRLALRLRREEPVLVLTPMSAGETGLEAMVRSMGLPGAAPAISEAQLVETLRHERLPVHARMTETAINFEYEA